MSIRNKGLVLAMEEDEIITDPAPVAEVEPEVPAEVEAEVAEVQQDEVVVDDLNTSIEEAIEDTETLGDITEVMDESVEKGEGLDETAAAVTEIAVESICARLGVRKQNVLPATESFGSSNSRVAATRIASEGVKEVIVTAWNAIKKAFANMWAKIVELFKKIFDANTKLAGAAKSLKTKIAAIGAKKPAAAEFEAAPLAAAFGRKDGFKPEYVVEVLTTHATLNGDIVAIGGDVETMLKEIEAVIAAAKGGEADKISDSVKKGLEKATAMAGGQKSSGKWVSKTLVGGKQLRIEGVEGVSGSVFKVYEAEVEKAKDDKVAVGTAVQLESICDEVIKLSESGDKLKAKAGVIGDVEKQFNKLIDKAISTAVKAEGAAEASKEVKADLDAAKKAVASIGNGYGKMAARVPAMSLTAGKLALNYVSASLKQYKAEEKK